SEVRDQQDSSEPQKDNRRLQHHSNLPFSDENETESVKRCRDVCPQTDVHSLIILLFSSLCSFLLCKSMKNRIYMLGVLISAAIRRAQARSDSVISCLPLITTSAEDCQNLSGADSGIKVST